MTITYQGNNIGLEYDATTATWGLNNTPTDYIDTEAFASTDPDFVYTPPTTDTPDNEEEDFNPCPAGYIYDSELKQCVIEPNAESNFMQTMQNQGSGGPDRPPVKIAGTDRFTSDNNFIATDEEYSDMSAQDLIENLKQRGFVDKNKETGQLEIDLTKGSIVAGFLDSQLSKFGQKENTQLNKKKKIIGLLVDKNIIDTTTAYPRGGMSATGDGSDIPNKVVIPTITLGQAKLQKVVPSLVVDGYGGSVFGTNLPSDRPDQFGDITTGFNKSVNNYASNFTNAYLKESGVGDIRDEQEQIRKAQQLEKLKKAKYDTKIKAIEARRKADQLRREAEQDQKDSEQEQQQSEERNRVQDEYKEKGQVTYSTKDTGGYVTTPNKPSAPPGERGGGGYSPPSKPKSKPRTGPDLTDFR